MNSECYAWQHICPIRGRGGPKEIIDEIIIRDSDFNSLNIQMIYNKTL